MNGFAPVATSSSTTIFANPPIIEWSAYVLWAEIGLFALLGLILVGKFVFRGIRNGK